MEIASQDVLVQLRQELKTWERSFASNHGGRKANRADIKAHPEIASLYKKYNDLSAASRPVRHASKRSTQATSQESPQLPLDHKMIRTPRKVHRHAASPRKTPVHVLSPTPHAIRQRLGPTPQKDGQILGLFDTFLSATPSKSRIALSTLDENVAATPSRRSEGMEMEEGKIRHSRTPTSSGKRFMLDTFATPVKRKRDDVAQTPTGGKGTDSTPQFLRRNKGSFASRLETVNEKQPAHGRDGGGPPFKKRPLVRSLSSIIRGLKEQQEALFDDEMEAMREAEAEETGQAPVSHEQKSSVPDSVDVEPAAMPLGPDMPVVSDEDDFSDDPSGLDKDGNPRKVWKKKGLKRQTKQVKMRPAPRATTGEAPPSLSSLLPHDKENEEPDDEYNDSDDVTEGKETKHVPAQEALKKKRKVNEAAHANFRRLKIKNKNSKAKGRGRFGRR